MERKAKSHQKLKAFLRRNLSELADLVEFIQGASLNCYLPSSTPPFFCFNFRNVTPLGLSSLDAAVGRPKGNCLLSAYLSDYIISSSSQLLLKNHYEMRQFTVLYAYLFLLRY